MKKPNHFIKDADPPWSQATTLEAWVIKMIEEGKTKEPEFQAALNVYGRARFEEIWKRHRQEKGEGK